eukprot:8752180-Pyramimonas_sp.AAC.1
MSQQEPAKKVSRKSKGKAAAAVDSTDNFEIVWEPPRPPRSRGPIRLCFTCNKSSKDWDQEFGLCSPGQETGDKPTPDLWVCRKCNDWLVEHLPDTEYRDLYNDKQKDEQLALQVRNVLREGDGSAPAVHVDQTMAFSSSEKVGYYIQDEYELLTYEEVLTETKQTPKTLNVRSVLRMNAKGEKEVRYAVPSANRPRPIMTVVSKVTAKVAKAKRVKKRD